MQALYRFIARYLAKRPYLVRSIVEQAKRTPYTHIMSRDGKREYMRRWWLFNPYDNEDGGRRKYPWIPMSIRIHEILLPDDDKHLHDHPWDAQTIILKGWYREERDNPDFDGFIPIFPGNLPIVTRLMSPGDTSPIRFGEFHRITSKSTLPVTTLFITFGFRGTWGFRVNGVKVPYGEYLAERRQIEEDEANDERFALPACDDEVTSYGGTA